MIALLLALTATGLPPIPCDEGIRFDCSTPGSMVRITADNVLCDTFYPDPAKGCPITIDLWHNGPCLEAEYDADGDGSIEIGLLDWPSAGTVTFPVTEPCACLWNDDANLGSSSQGCEYRCYRSPGGPDAPLRLPNKLPECLTAPPVAVEDRR